MMASLVVLPRASQAISCMALLDPLRAGYSNGEIAYYWGVAEAEVDHCRRELSRPIVVGPAGPPPKGAVGPPAWRPAGPPALGAAGPP
ncbi:MAG TPA: hypothetical protein VEB21_18785, partial [Terriglobales bacterium]|nr:hypothetical protein [Terriglobales bacterium]